MPKSRYHIHIIDVPGNQPEIDGQLILFLENKAFITRDLLITTDAATNYSRRCIDACDFVIMVISDSYGNTNMSGVSQLHLSYLTVKTKNKPILILIKSPSEVKRTRQLIDFIDTVEQRGPQQLYYFKDLASFTDVLEQSYEAMRETVPEQSWIKAGNARNNSILALASNTSALANKSILRSNMALESRLNNSSGNTVALNSHIGLDDDLVSRSVASKEDQVLREKGFLRFSDIKKDSKDISEVSKSAVTDSSLHEPILHEPIKAEAITNESKDKNVAVQSSPDSQGLNKTLSNDMLSEQTLEHQSAIEDKNAYVKSDTLKAPVTVKSRPKNHLPNEYTYHISPDSLQTVSFNDKVDLTYDAHAYQDGNIKDVVITTSVSWKRLLQVLTQLSDPFSPDAMYRALNDEVALSAPQSVAKILPKAHAVAKCVVRQADFIWIKDHLVFNGWLSIVTRQVGQASGRQFLQLTDEALTLLASHR